MSPKKYWQLSQFQLSRIIKGVVCFSLIKAGLLAWERLMRRSKMSREKVSKEGNRWWLVEIVDRRSRLLSVVHGGEPHQQRLVKGHLQRLFFLQPLFLPISHFSNHSIIRIFFSLLLPSIWASFVFWWSSSETTEPKSKFGSFSGIWSQDKYLPHIEILREKLFVFVFPLPGLSRCCNYGGSAFAEHCGKSTHSGEEPMKFVVCYSFPSQAELRRSRSLFLQHFRLPFSGASRRHGQPSGQDKARLLHLGFGGCGPLRWGEQFVRTSQAHQAEAGQQLQPRSNIRKNLLGKSFPAFNIISRLALDPLNEFNIKMVERLLTSEVGFPRRFHQAYCSVQQYLCNDYHHQNIFI